MVFVEVIQDPIFGKFSGEHYTTLIQILNRKWSHLLDQILHSRN